MKTYRKEPQKQEAGRKRVISQETECTKFIQSGVLFSQYFPGRILRLIILHSVSWTQKKICYTYDDTRRVVCQRFSEDALLLVAVRNINRRIIPGLLKYTKTNCLFFQSNMNVRTLQTNWNNICRFNPYLTEHNLLLRYKDKKFNQRTLKVTYQSPKRASKNS